MALRDEPLRPDQHANPVLWFRPLTVPVEVPLPADFEDVFKNGKRSRLLRSWGHGAAGPRSPHWFATRGGIGLHVDAAYLRYTHHLVIRNDGFRVRGLDDSVWHPEMVRGALYCIDTHSPHEVVLDGRMEQIPDRLKVSLVIDAARILTPAYVTGTFHSYVKRAEAKALIGAGRPQRAGG